MKDLNGNVFDNWHREINKSREGAAGKNYMPWVYDARTVAQEIPRLAILFRMERLGELPKIHRQCSHSEPEPVIDNHLSCCMGVKCKECPFLKVAENSSDDPEEVDQIKSWICATHILSEKSKNPFSFDASEGYILTVDDKMYWQNVYNSLMFGMGDSGDV